MFLSFRASQSVAFGGRSAVSMREPSRGGTGIRLNIASPKFIEWKTPTKSSAVRRNVVKNASGV